MFVNIGVAIMKILLMGDIMGAIWEGLACLILYGGIKKLNYCSLLMYIVLTLF